MQSSEGDWSGSYNTLDHLSSQQSITSTQTTIHPSQHTTQYTDFFRQFNLNKHPELTQSRLDQHRIKILQPSQKQLLQLGTETLKVIVQKVQRGGAVITYHVVIGQFLIDIVMLNVDRNAPSLGRGMLSRNSVNEIVTIEADNTRKMLAKRMMFQYATTKTKDPMKMQDLLEHCPKYSDIEALVIQCGFSKLGSMLMIGPEIYTLHGFDMVCFRNCVEFYMEKCQSFPFENFQQHSWQDVQLQLANCLHTLHNLNLIHKDIKPDNILFSPTLNRFVLADFGISMSILQPIGQKTLTYRQGTLRFMSPDMMDIPRDTKGYVDLYFNDVHSMLVSFEMMRNDQYLGTKSRMRYENTRIANSVVGRGGVGGGIGGEKTCFYRNIRHISRSYRGQTGQEAIVIGESAGFKVFRDYFPELLKETVGEIVWNPMFLLGSLGLNNGKLELYLNNCKESELTQQIRKKLQKHPFLYPWWQGPKPDTDLQTRRFLQRQLRKIQTKQKLYQQDQNLLIDFLSKVFFIKIFQPDPQQPKQILSKLRSRTPSPYLTNTLKKCQLITRLLQQQLPLEQIKASISQFPVFDNRITIEIGLTLFHRTNLKAALMLLQPVEKLMKGYDEHLARAYRIVEGPRKAIEYLRRNRDSVEAVGGGGNRWVDLTRFLAEELVFCERLEEAKRVCQEALPKLTPTQKINLLPTLALILRSKGQHQETSSGYLQQSQQLRHSLLQQTSISNLIALSNLSNLCQKLQRPLQSYRLLLKAQELTKMSGVSDNIRLTELYRKMAENLVTTGDFEQVLRLSERSLEGCQKDKVKAMQYMSAFGGLKVIIARKRGFRGDRRAVMEEGVRLMREAVEVGGRELGDSALLGIMQCELAAVYLEMGQYANAVKYYNMSLESIKQHLCKYHIIEVRCYLGLALTSLHLHKPQESLKHTLKAQSLLEHTKLLFGPHQLMELYCTTALLYSEHNLFSQVESLIGQTHHLKFESVDRYFPTCIKLGRTLLDKDHTELALKCFNMMEGTGRKKVLFERVLCLYRLGRDEECMREIEEGGGDAEGECLRVQAELWFRRGEKEKAEGCLRKALKIYTETRNYQENVRRPGFYNNIGKILLRMGKTSQSAGWFRTSILLLLLQPSPSPNPNNQLLLLTTQYLLCTATTCFRLRCYRLTRTYLTLALKLKLHFNQNKPAYYYLCKSCWHMGDTRGFLRALLLMQKAELNENYFRKLTGLVNANSALVALVNGSDMPRCAQQIDDLPIRRRLGQETKRKMVKRLTLLRVRKGYSYEDRRRRRYYSQDPDGLKSGFFG